MRQDEKNRREEITNYKLRQDTAKLNKRQEMRWDKVKQNVKRIPDETRHKYLEKEKKKKEGRRGEEKRPAKMRQDQIN